jgi:hypothetical protein
MIKHETRLAIMEQATLMAGSFKPEYWLPYSEQQGQEILELLAQIDSIINR